MQIHSLLLATLLTGLLFIGCQGIDIFSPGPLDRGLCRSARAGGEDVSQCLEAQQMMRR